jgi:hypothetical protein
MFVIFAIWIIYLKIIKMKLNSFTLFAELFIQLIEVEVGEVEVLLKLGFFSGF